MRAEGRRLVLAIDQSTQGSKAVLFDAEGGVVSKAARLHRQIVNERGWVEHDPEEIMTNVLAVARDACKQGRVSSGEVVAVGISNQRETCLAWDRERREPLHNAIVWQCGRAREVCDLIRKTRPDDVGRVCELSGMELSPYFSAAKLSWLMRNIADVRRSAEEGTLCLGTIDSWLLFKLCESEHPFVTEPSNACRTQLLDVRTGQWSFELCELFGVPESALAKVIPSDSVFGHTTMGGLFAEPVPVCGVLGDSQAALAAQNCFVPGDVKATYGTGSSVMMQTGEGLVRSQSGLVASIAWDFSGKRSYVLEGNLNYTGATITWLCDQMRLIGGPEDVEPAIARANPDDGAYFVPAFTGLGAPWWDSAATGMLTGVTRITGRDEFVKACAESIPYQVADVLAALRSDSGLSLGELRADGGVTRNRYLMQFQADVSRADVVVSGLAELSAAGAAFVAGRSAGLYERNEIYERVGRKRYAPERTPEEAACRLEGWHAAVEQVRAHG